MSQAARIIGQPTPTRVLRGIRVTPEFAEAALGRKQGTPHPPHITTRRSCRLKLSTHRPQSSRIYSPAVVSVQPKLGPKVGMVPSVR
eukprot:6444667-Amphidinium_carterae.1